MILKKNFNKEIICYEKILFWFPSFDQLMIDLLDKLDPVT